MTRNFGYAGTALLAATLFFAPHARADEIYDTCIDKSDGTNTAWAACGGEWIEREDKKLNIAWKRLYASLDGQTKIDVLAEQRAWIAYKEASCEFYGNGDWGREGQVLYFLNCRAEVIATRTHELDEIYEFVSPK